MRSPYNVLGVPENASDDEIKKAYRRLSRKYHPDANINNPNKEAAEEKFKEVQEAYKQIMDIRSGKGSGYKTAYGESKSGGSNPFNDFDFGGFGSFGEFNQRRQASSTETADEKYLTAACYYISEGLNEEALKLLVQIKTRNARWYFLSAVANLNVGNNIIAERHAAQAVNMEPYNTEYRSLYLKIKQGTAGYRQKSAQYGGMQMSSFPCVCCMTNMLCDLCCRCIRIGTI